jgi:hypothetical protein
MVTTDRNGSLVAYSSVPAGGFTALRNFAGTSITASTFAAVTEARYRSVATTPLTISEGMKFGMVAAT